MPTTIISGTIKEIFPKLKVGQVVRTDGNVSSRSYMRESPIHAIGENSDGKRWFSLEDYTGGDPEGYWIIYETCEGEITILEDENLLLESHPRTKILNQMKRSGMNTGVQFCKTCHELVLTGHVCYADKR